MKFSLQSPYKPAGDQPQAIKELLDQFKANKQRQTLLGVTGSGKTFTMANVIQQLNLPTLIIAHNKTLAGQLYQEFRDFFPENAVSYFVSYYDYYQPEAYIPSSDTYIEKEATINDEIDKLRLASTTNLLTREDCIVVASVSCIYNLGSPVEYGKNTLEIMEGEIIARETLLLQLSNLQYQRSDNDLLRGTYRLRGDTIQLWPAYLDTAINIETLENKIITIKNIDPISGSPIQIKSQPQPSGPLSTPNQYLTSPNYSTETPKSRRQIIYPAKHYTTNPITQDQAIADIESDLQKRLIELRQTGKIVEAYRLEQKVNYDLDMIREVGFVNGIENYSRYFDGRQPGQPPFTLLDYFKENAKIFHKPDFLTIVDESHMTMPQVGGMYHGDQSRKQTLIEYGFRLPSAIDNRPLTSTEFLNRMNKMLFVSATPAPWEVSQSGNQVVEQLIRPTGLVDPTIDLRPITAQIEDLILEIIKRKKSGQRALVTTLTKKMAESLTEYLNDRQKIDQLLINAKQKNDAYAAGDNPETLIQSGLNFPIDEMPIDKIDPSYFTHSFLDSSLFEKNNTNSEMLPDENYPKVMYLHSDIETLERADILADLRQGVYDVVVGINLLREGLDLPEVTLVAILDADKEGFLRSSTSLVQTIGRAARHESGHVILYADRLTKSMQKAIGETQRRRTKQLEHNKLNQISPQTIFKPIRKRMVAANKTGASRLGAKDIDPRTIKQEQFMISLGKGREIDITAIDPESFTPADRKRIHLSLRRKMRLAAQDMDFELAAALRDAAKKIDL